MGHIEMFDLIKRFDSKVVVDRFSLDIRHGEFIVLLGPSGCGKTTVLRMIAGLEDISGGRLVFDGELGNEVPPDLRNVGMVFQNYALYPHMTVEKNLSFGLESVKRSGSRSQAKQQIKNRVFRIAKLLELEHLLDKRPKQLSGGQRQRVALGRALIRRPSVFLMDEPLSNLDANLRERVRMDLGRLHQELGITTVYVTHDQVEALTLADRIVVMNEGKVLQVGSPREVYALPEDTFVARFIGTPGMNLWSLPWTDEGCDLRLGSSVVLPNKLLDTIKKSPGEVVLGIRPEHLVLNHTGQKSEVLVKFRIDMIEHLGSHQLAHGYLAYDRDTRGIVQLDSDSFFQIGDEICLGAALDQVHLFDIDGGKRLEAQGDESFAGVMVNV